MNSLTLGLMLAPALNMRAEVARASMGALGPMVPPALAEARPSKPVEVAVAEFLAQMLEYAAGEQMLLRHVCRSYDQLAEGHRWPALSTKALSQALVKHGCRRGQRNTRRTDGKRLTTIQFPEAAC